MTAYIFYSKNTPADRDIERFVYELGRLQVETKLVDADSVEGSRLTQVYDLMDRPAVVLARGDGTVVERWPHGLPLPGDISYLAHS